MMIQFGPSNRIKFGAFYTFVLCVSFNSPVLGGSSSNDQLTSSLGDFHDTFIPEAMLFDSKRISRGDNPSSAKISSRGKSSPSSSEQFAERSDTDGYYDYYEESLIDDDKSKSKSNESNSDSTKISKRFGFASPNMMPHIPPTLPSMKRRFDIPSPHNPRNYGWSFQHSSHLPGIRSLPHHHSSYTPMESAPHPSMIGHSNNLGRLFDHVRFAESRPSAAHVAHHHDHVHKHHHHSPNSTSRVSAYASYGVRNKGTGNRLDPAQSESKTSENTRSRLDIPLNSMHESLGDESSQSKDSRDFDMPTSDAPLTASASDKDTANDAASKYDHNNSENDPDSFGRSQNSPASSSSTRNAPSSGRYRINTYSQHSLPGNRRQEEQEAMRPPRYRVRPRQYQGMPPPSMPAYEGSIGGQPGGPYGDPMTMADGVLPPTLAGGDPEGMPLYGGEEYALTGLRGQLPIGLGGEGTYPLIGGPNPMPPFHFPMGGMPGPMGGGPMGGGPMGGGPGGMPMGGPPSQPKPSESGQQQSASSNQADYSVNNLQKMHPGLHPMQYQYLTQWYSYLNQPMIRSYIENFKDPNESNDDKQKQSASNEDKSSSRWFRNLRLFPLSLQKIQLPRVREIFDRIRPQTTSTTTESSSSTEFA
ncbi:uncharacterized protein LOC141849910 [Brevipalpus obovatus]|uniref:uncharacterized protein LOC141849910 n=1 Tax=Brevipalpus obovatus TaxID=246614 RepID=UPI003D9DC7AA